MLKILTVNVCEYGNFHPKSNDKKNNNESLFYILLFSSHREIPKPKRPENKTGKEYDRRESGKKNVCRRNHTATVGMPRKRQHYQEYSLLLEILVLHNNKRYATVSAFLHIDLYINTSIFILLIANVTSK